MQARVVRSGASPLSRPASSLALGLVASLFAHWLLVRAVPARLLEARRVEVVWAIAGPASGTTESVAGTQGTMSHERAELVAGGSTARDNVDARRRGGGGEVTGAYEVLVLVTEAAPITLVDAPLNAAQRSQIQRIDTASDRASWDDRRATPRPHDDPFLAAGPGEHRERRPLASLDAREGARQAPHASVEGDRALGVGAGTRTGVDSGALMTTREPRAVAAPSSREGMHGDGREGGPAGRRVGATQSSPGVGILAGRGPVSSVHARVATGRPSVDLGPAATVAEDEGRVRDDRDAELLAAQLFEARADASRRHGERLGEGRGGVSGLAGEGSGGSGGVGGHAAPYGPGGGAFAALDTSDTRYRTWLLTQRRRIEQRLVFPRARQLARDQGTAVVRLAIRRDGSLVRAPRVIRTSGHDDLDDAALVAVRQSLPFERVPSDVAVGHTELVVVVPVEFANPMTE